MIDFHCHLDLYDNPHSVLREAVERKCYLLAVTTTPLAWEGTRSLVGNAPGVQVAAGLHPELALARRCEIDQLCALLPEARYVGEIGLDGSRQHCSSLPIQREVFEAILNACESVGGRIMTIHSRGAASLVLDYLETYDKAGLPVMHWFSGTHIELARAIELDCWFSVGPAMLQGAKGRRLASQMPLDRILTETDGPLARRANSPLMPWDAEKAEKVLGSIWKLPHIAVRQQLSQNFRQLVSALT